MRVSYKEGSNLKEITILGPWDPGEDVVSYRAPVAAGMLGIEEGGHATLELPSGPIKVTIQSVEQAV
jgi:transcription elongation GreA/GreB family factor